NEVCGICSGSLVTGDAVQCDLGATLRIAGADLVERRLRPSDSRRDTKCWLRAARRAAVDGDAEASADRAPNIERFTIELVSTEDHKAKQGGHEHDHGK